MGVREDAIIVMDDVSLMRRRIASLLQGCNIHVYEAVNSEELFDLLFEEDMNVRLIIMELGFDANEGLENLMRIKDKKPNIPVFIITANNKRQTFIGVFPYCTATNVDLIQNKTMDYFDKVIKKGPELTNLQIAIATITYPMVEMEPKEVLISLGRHIDKLIAVKKKEEEMKNYYR